MPNAFEFPRVRRAVVPLVSSGDAVVRKLVAHRLPRLTAIIGPLHYLPGPATRLRRVDPVRISGRSLQVVDLPSRKVRAVDIPMFALAVRSQDERALPRTHQNPYLAHLSPASFVQLSPQ